MRTRSQTRNRNRQQQAQPAVVQPFHLEEPFVNPPLVPMADNRTMAQLLQAPTEGYEDAIVIPEINANFELKHGSARIWLEKEPPRSILTWDDLVSKFINQFFPPSKTTNLRNEITRFQQRFDESFYEAWDRFNDLLRACPHHGFSELHQLDTFYNALNANDQDSLNSAAGGNFLDKMPRECLKIIESKSKVRNSRNKAVVAKVSSNSSTPGISPDVAALTTEVSELKNMMKTMLIDKQKAQAPVPVKAVEQSCVTCGGAHSYRNCPATDGNVYRDNIQEYVSQAAAANFNQGNTNSRPPMVANQIRPPGFPPIQNNQNRFNQNQGNNFNQNRGTNFNQNRGNNFYQGQVYQPPTSQPPVYQAHPYQAPAPQMQGVSKTDFENYVKANDAILRNMQNQGQGLQNQMTNLTKMLSKFVNSNTASTSSSGSLPSNTVTNPKEDLKGITTRSGVVYQGPTIPTSSPKVVERRTEVTKDTIFPTNNGITEDVQPPVVPIENPVSEPVNAPVESSDPEDDIDEIDAFLAMKVSLNFEEGYFDSEGDVIFFKNLLSDDTTYNLAPEVISDHELNESIHNTSITFSPRSDPLHHEFAHSTSSRSQKMFMLIKVQLSVPPPPSLPVSPILIEDSDLVQEEIDIFLVSDDLIPPGVENDDSEDEDNELPNLDHQDNPSSPRPPLEPPDVCLDFKPNTAMKNDEDFNQGEIVLSINVEDVNSFTFVDLDFSSIFHLPRDSLVFTISQEMMTYF
ncbi:reverse transcriptase domain-containing protein [Tanacetum coccineum]|uniref:Reverse transcriptase domain-containing protein n=1 Tax=Tanacetum coccineum TaxID=301880 RepID=A0ABQ5BRP6_9ASTR